MSKFDSLLKKVELFEKLADYGDRKAFLQSLSQAYPTPSLTGPTVPTPGTAGTPGGRPLSLSEKLTGQPKTDPRYIELAPGEGDPRYVELAPGEGETSPISVQTQEKLNDLIKDLVIGGKIAPMAPLRLDGKMGPATQKALETVLKQWGQPANQPLSQLVQTVNTLYDMKQYT